MMPSHTTLPLIRIRLVTQLHCARAVAALTIFAIFSCVFNLAQALTLDEALYAAATYAPEITASQANIEANEALRITAGTLPDPRLTITLDDFMLEGHNRYQWNTTKRSISIMQDIPNSDKRQAQRLLAEANLSSSLSQNRFVRLNARRETTLAWLQLYYLEQKIQILIQQQNENLLQQASTRASLAAGGPAASAIAAQIEQTTLADEQDKLHSQILSARARLARQIGESLAHQPMTGELPAWLNEEHGFTISEEQQPELRTTQAQVSAVQAQLALAIAEKKSDWGFEIGFGQDTMGDTMAMVQFTFSLPVFSSTRQNPQIAAASAAVRRADAQHAARRADYQQQFNALLAERDSLNTQLHRLNTQTLPLLSQQINLALASYSSAQGSVQDVIAARNARLSGLLRQVDLQSQLADINAQLYFLAGGNAHE